MKAQILLSVLLFFAITTSVLAQDRSQSKNPVVPEHPLFKYLPIFENSSEHQTAFKTANENFQLNSVEQQVWNTDTWVSYLKSENTYQAGKRVESRGYFIPVPGESWELDSREMYDYTDGLLTSYTLEGISENERITGERSLFSYQVSGGVTLPQTVIFQYWDDEAEEWNNEDRTTIVAENGVIVGGAYDEWDIDDWLEVDQFTLEEIDGDLVETTFIYDLDIEEWVNYEQTIYSDITSADLYEQFFQFYDQIADGSLFYLFSMLPDYTAYEWMDEGESGSWVATERLVTVPSTELENGATSAFISSMEYNIGEPDDWMAAYQVLVGLADNDRPVAMSFYTPTDEGESEELQKVFSEEYMYNSNDLLEEVLKSGSWDDFAAFKQQDNHATGRAVLTWGDVITSIDDPAEQPLSFSLNAAYPNPFNPSTVIPFQMASASAVKIEVFDMLGRHVTTLVDEFIQAGNHTIRFDGSGLSSGVYMIRMDAPGLQQTRSVTLLK